MSTKENVSCKVYENHSQDTRYKDLGEVCQTVSATWGGGGNNQPFVVYDGSRRHNYEPFNEVCETVQSYYGTGGGNVPMVMENFNSAGFKYRNGSKARSIGYEVERSPTIGTDGNFSVFKNKNDIDCVNGTGGGNTPMVQENTVVRRLTPTECSRLQGYPDGWCDIGEWVDSNGKKHKDADSPKYKALGNSIALPFWEWMIGRMAKQLREDGVENPTMGSLFDGIGGFPLVSQRNGITPVWASEIEEFPIAVTKRRFPEDE